MKPRWTIGGLAVMALIAVVAIAGAAREWSETQALRAEVELAQIEAAELGRVRAENLRLREKQTPAELARLRADHAALPRLRAELDGLKSAASPAR